MVCFHISFFATVLDDLTGPLSIGKAIGSVRIDEAFQAEVERRLGLIDREDEEDPGISKYTAHDMAKNHFQSIKTQFGTPMQELLDEIILHVPGLRKDFYHMEAKISHGSMIFTK